ncbi:MAG: DUF1501 domain-containing protein [Planctomycetes bacterium]|nr:DUF1501 domain-containing protein [Planctomycetota bacterium]MCW8136837.1 DUF1501 domain-containing protein [Planctomycetota bacterium]
MKLNHSRRGFLQVCAAGAGVIATGALAGPRGTSVKAAPLSGYKRLVIINLVGGNDGLNTVFPVTGAAATNYLSRRPGLAMTSGQGLSLAGGPGVSDFRLHPALDTLQGIWNAGELAIIQKVGYPNANLSHFVSEDVWSTGVRSIDLPSGTARGWVARYANQYAPTPTGVISIGMGRRLDFDGATGHPLLIKSVGAFKYEADWVYGNNHILRLDTYAAMLAKQPSTGLAGQVAGAKLAAHNAVTQMATALSDYNAAGPWASYPTTINGFTGYLGGNLRDIAALMYGGMDTRVFYTGIWGGFDTHSAQEPMHTNLLNDLDNAVAAFRADLQAMNVWNDTVVLVISEFGRRNYENGSDGTDHGHGSVVFALGGAVNGGMYGDPPTASDINAEQLGYTTDFRDVYRHVLQDHLGHSAAGVFPESQPVSKTMNFL